jgi:hypothetical protein
MHHLLSTSLQRCIVQANEAGGMALRQVTKQWMFCGS